MSIHKSQGQTLERVKVDLGRVFEKGRFIIECVYPHTDEFLGQAYVALSRATSLDGLQVLNFDAKKVSRSMHSCQSHHSLALLGTKPSQGCRVEQNVADCFGPVMRPCAAIYRPVDF